MTDAYAPGAPARLYSQTPYDDRGNFHYRGDLYRQGERFDALVGRLGQHLATHFSDASFSVRAEKFSGGRKITAELLDWPDDLRSRDAQNSTIVAVRDQMERFGFTDSNPLQDYHSCSFYCDVPIGRAYWAALAMRNGLKNPVDRVVSLAAFRKRVKAGDQLKLIDAPKGHHALGTTRTITQVRSNDLILDGHSYLTLPRASAFACDGKHVRIANGSEYDPDGHLLYEWHCQAA